MYNCFCIPTYALSAKSLESLRVLRKTGHIKGNYTFLQLLRIFYLSKRLVDNNFYIFFCFFHKETDIFLKTFSLKKPLMTAWHILASWQ